MYIQYSHKAILLVLKDLKPLFHKLHLNYKISVTNLGGIVIYQQLKIMTLSQPHI